MKQKIIINADSYETRIAILEDGELAELLVERADQRRHVGDIYKGRVNAVLPGMQAAFVDLGLPKTGSCMPPIWPSRSASSKTSPIWTRTATATTAAAARRRSRSRTI